MKAIIFFFIQNFLFDFRRRCNNIKSLRDCDRCVLGMSLFNSGSVWLNSGSVWLNSGSVFHNSGGVFHNFSLIFHKIEVLFERPSVMD